MLAVLLRWSHSTMTMMSVLWVMGLAVMVVVVVVTMTWGWTGGIVTGMMVMLVVVVVVMAGSGRVVEAAQLVAVV